MGSQQILMIVLGVVVVGIAVAISLLFFDQSAEQSSRDALAQDCLKLASNAQGYFQTPAMLGGGNNSFDGITIRDCGMEADARGEGHNLSGVFSIADAEGMTVSIRATSATDPSKSVTVLVDMRPADPSRRLSVAFAGW